MGTCQSRDSIQKVTTKPTSDIRSLGSGSLASEKSEVTIAASNHHHHHVVGTPIQEENEDDISQEDSEGGDKNGSSEIESLASSGPVDTASVQDGKQQSIVKDENSSSRDPDGGYKPSSKNSERNPSTRQLPSSEATSNNDADSAKAPQPRRSIFSKSTSSQASTDGGFPVPGKPVRPSPAPKEKSSGKRPGKSRKPPPMPSFSLSQVTISEEVDPDMPSDEEDFREDLVRNTPNDEPGRLVPVKIKSRPSTRVESVGIVGGSGLEAMNPDDLTAVHLQTLSEFQRLKLQVKLQKHQEMKERRVSKVEDRVQDSQAYKKLWADYKMAEKAVARLEHCMAQNPAERQDSFDLKDSDSWFFDFQSVEEGIPGASSEQDDGSQASLSLLSEQSLDAQKRYYAEKRRKRKEKKKQGKLESKQSGLESEEAGSISRMQSSSGQISTSGSLVARVSITPDALARLNMTTSTLPAPARDYGPLRENHYRVNPNGSTNPLNVEVSFQNVPSQPDDAGSYVSDLGDESWTGGGNGNGSVSSALGRAARTAPTRPNDYGVKRRIRTGAGNSGYSQQDHALVQSKLKSLEESLAQMRSARQQTEGSGNAAQIDAPPKAVGTGKYAGVPLEELIKMLDAAAKSTSKDKAGEATERELALQIQQAIRVSTAKSGKKKSHKDKRTKEKPPLAEKRTATGPLNSVAVAYEGSPQPALPQGNHGSSLGTPTNSVPKSFSTPSVRDDVDRIGVHDNVSSSPMAGMSSPQDNAFLLDAGRRLFVESGSQRNTPIDQLGELAGRCNDDDSAATGPLEAPDSDHTEEKKDDQPCLQNTVSTEKQVLLEEDDGSKSRASSTHNPVIASMSKEDFFRLRYASLVADKSAIRQEPIWNEHSPVERELEEDSNLDTSDEVGTEEPKIPSSFWTEELDSILLKNIIPERAMAAEKGEVAPVPITPSSHDREDPPSSSFWTDELNEILLKNYIPERTDVNCDHKYNMTPMTAILTPEATPTSIYSSPGGFSPEDDDGSDDQSHIRYLPDPDGRRIDPSEEYPDEMVNPV